MEMSWSHTPSSVWWALEASSSGVSLEGDQNSPPGADPHGSMRARSPTLRPRPQMPGKEVFVSFSLCKKLFIGERKVLVRKVSLLERCPHFRDVLREGFHCNHMCRWPTSMTTPGKVRRERKTPRNGSSNSQTGEP